MKTDLELRHLRVFAAVAEVGTYTGAARVLGVSQSTVSETLGALERTLGAPLFRRTPKGPTLTASGQALVPYAQRMLALSAELIAGIAKISSAVSATVTISAVESVCAYVLPPRLQALRARWPQVRVEVVSSACAAIREAVAAGKSDLGLVLETDSGLADESILAKGRLVIFGAAGHPLANRRASADELRRHDFYMSDAAGDYHSALRRLFEAAQLPAPRTHPLGTVEGVKAGILAGGSALGLLPAHSIQQELHDRTFAEVGTSPALTGLVLRAVLPPEAARSPVVEELLHSLRGVPLGSAAGAPKPGA
jgi:DNA-binding transcriptional LysR family regulator